MFPDAEISKGELDFSFKNKNLNFLTAQETLYKVQKTAGDLLGESTDMRINSVKKNFLFFKKYNYRIDLDLQNIKYADDLELTFNIINPSRVSVRDPNNISVEVSISVNKN